MDTSGTISRHFNAIVRMKVGLSYCSYNKITLNMLYTATTNQQQQGNISIEFEGRVTSFQGASTLYLGSAL